MLFRSIAHPPPSKGVDFSKVEKVVVPNQAISLETMLRRFTLGEELEVAKSGNYVDDLSDNDDYSHPDLQGVDLEKLAKADLVDKEEFAKKLRKTTETFEQQERRMKAEAKKKAEEKKDGGEPSGSA